VGQIQDLIEKGKLKHGDQLPPERELSAIFQVSRHSVREAIRILEEKEILKSRPGSGTYVIMEDKDSVVAFLAKAIHEEKGKIREIFQFRRLIEPQIASLAAENATSEDIKELKKILKSHEKNIENILESISYDEDFHLAIARATGNSIVLKMVERINDIVVKTRTEASQTVKRRQESIKSHLKIIDSIEKRDSFMAFQAMDEHLMQVENIVIHHTKQNYD
jgi:GntR family transcriptional repressor for pyruvate dehydrogenase complex